MKQSIRLELESQHLALLDAYKRKTGAPRVETIRRAILAYFKQEGGETKLLGEAHNERPAE